MSQVKITVFDDGNDVYKRYENIWNITGSKFHGSKVELTNAVEKEIKINSISAWKVQIIEKNSVNYQP
jgi:hypothetical protein